MAPLIKTKNHYRPQAISYVLLLILVAYFILLRDSVDSGMVLLLISCTAAVVVCEVAQFLMIRHARTH